MANLPPAIVRGKSGKTHDIFIPAKGRYTLDVVGSTLTVLASPCRVRVKIDSGSATDLRAGTSIDAIDAAYFERLEFENTTDAEIVIVVYVGFAKFRVDTSETVDAPTEFRGHTTGVPIPPHSGVTFSGGTTGKFRQRRSLFVSNLSQELDLYVRDSEGAIVTVLFPRQSYTLQGSGALELFNPNSAAVDWAAGSSWYTELAR